MLKGSHYFNLGDHGGVLVAVKYFKTEGWTDELLYSTNEGVEWKRLKFYHEPLRIFGLLTEPGQNTTTFTMFGTASKMDGEEGASETSQEILHLLSRAAAVLPWDQTRRFCPCRHFRDRVDHLDR